jgi:hypothetical protein
VVNQGFEGDLGHVHTEAVKWLLLCVGTCSPPATVASGTRLIGTFHSPLSAHRNWSREGRSGSISAVQQPNRNVQLESKKLSVRLKTPIMIADHVITSPD